MDTETATLKNPVTDICVTLTSGALIKGTWVEGRIDMKIHGKPRESTWAGTYNGIGGSDDIPYHYFVNGHINGTAQTFFGMPVSQFASDTPVREPQPAPGHRFVTERITVRYEVPDEVSDSEVAGALSVRVEQVYTATHEIVGRVVGHDRAI